jgi:hypothetical protein
MLKDGTTDTDSSWSTVDGILLSFAEPAIGLICACLPIMWPIMKSSVKTVTTKSKSVLGSVSTRTNRPEGKSRDWSVLTDDQQRNRPDIHIMHDLEVSYGKTDIERASKESQHSWSNYTTGKGASVSVSGNV